MKRQAGIALITAIFVVAIASIAAVAMFEAANVSLHRGANLVQSEAELWYASGIESWVKGVLIEDAKVNGTQTVGLNGLWAQSVDFLPIDGGAIRGHMEDLQGRFNLNNLFVGQINNGTGAAAVGPLVYIEQLDRLLDNLPDFDGSKYHGLGYAIRDWVDADDQRSGTLGAEDQDYLSQDPPYRAANQPMSSVSELMLVKGMTKELYQALLPYVTVLPVTTAVSGVNGSSTATNPLLPGGTVTQINVNTAPVPVLMSLAPNINGAAVQKFVAARKSQPATSTSTISTGDLAFLPPQTNNGGTGVQPVGMGVNSSYFGLHAEVVIGSGRLTLYSVIYRPGTGTPVVLAHSTNSE
jgi:general secretion pathway protein K